MFGLKNRLNKRHKTLNYIGQKKMATRQTHRQTEQTELWNNFKGVK